MKYKLEQNVHGIRDTVKQGDESELLWTYEVDVV